MSGYWVNFAKSGNPNGQNLPLWPAFTDVGNQVLYLDTSIAVGGVSSIDSLTVFDSVYTMVRGKAFAVR